MTIEPGSEEQADQIVELPAVRRATDIALDELKAGLAHQMLEVP